MTEFNMNFNCTKKNFEEVELAIRMAIAKTSNDIGYNIRKVHEDKEFSEYNEEMVLRWMVWEYNPLDETVTFVNIRELIHEIERVFRVYNWCAELDCINFCQTDNKVNPEEVAWLYN